ncbi:MAG: RDD family protein [Bacteroidota bacterium]
METVSTGPSKDYAGFWLRFIALIIDSIVISIVYLFIVTPIFAALGFGFATAAEDLQSGSMSEEEALGLIGVITGVFATVGLIVQIIYILYFALMESSKFQGTVGKMALGIKVTDANGERVSFGTAFLRNLGKILSQIIIYIGFLMAAFTEKKQGLHDMIANTLVVRK